jgi:hypothetical protein
MALDPAVLKARIDRAEQSLRGRVEQEQLLRDLSPPLGRRDEDDA